MENGLPSSKAESDGGGEGGSFFDAWKMFGGWVRGGVLMKLWRDWIGEVV